MGSRRLNVLVTGVSHCWGSKLVPLLEDDPDIASVIGIDYAPLEKPFNKLEFFQIDTRHPLLAELLRTARIDVVCHLLFVDVYSPSEEVFDLNVMGTMDLVAACGASRTRRLVLPSDTKVYGAAGANPAYLAEHTDFRGRYRHPYVTHRMEIERMVDRFTRENDLPQVITLRFANILGNTVDTPMGRYLDENPVPTVFGFDPMYQLTHEDDVVAALHHAIKSEAVGPFNIAGDGVLPLGQVLRMANRVSLPFGAPFLRWGSSLVQKSPIPDSIPISTGFLKFPCVGDTRRMKSVLGFSPGHSSKQTVTEYVQQRRLEKYLPRPSQLTGDPAATERLEEYLSRRKRELNEPFGLLDEDIKDLFNE